MVVARLALAITVLFALSGCVTSGQEPSAEDVIQVLEDNGVEFSKPVTPTSTLHSLGNLSTNVTGLNLTLAITADGNGTLPFTVAWGDNTTSAGTLSPAVAVDQNVTPVGKLYVANVEHAYNATGLYNITVTVTGGNTTLNRTVEAAIGELGPSFGPTQDAMQLEGSVLCLPTFVLPGEIAGETLPFTVNEAQRGFTLTLNYDDPTVEDLDFTLTSPSGKEFVSDASGREPPMDVETPEAGEWTLQVIGYSCALELSFTVDIVFA